MEELITLLPDILKYFVPGYLALFLFKSITARRFETDIALIISCIISFITIAILEVLSALFETEFIFWGLCLAACFIDILLGIVAALIIKSDKVRTVLVNTFHITPNRSAINNVVDWKNGSNAKVYFKDMDYYIVGHIYSLEDNEENSWISLHCPMKLRVKDDAILYSQETNEDAYLAFPLSSVLYIEIIN